MPFCKILHDLKLAAVKLYQGNHLPLDDILLMTALFKAIRNREKVKRQLCVMFVRHMTGPRNRCQ
jgi:hypothetical protein